MSHSATAKRAVAADPVEARKAAFLAAYPLAFSISAAAKAAGIDRRTHYRWRRDDVVYADRFQAAQQEAAEMLESAARRRAVEGVRKYKFHNGKPIKHPVTGEPYFEYEFSDTLLIFLLKAAMPRKYRENFRHTGKPIRGHAQVADLSDEELTAIVRLPDNGRDKMPVDAERDASNAKPWLAHNALSPAG